MDKLPLLPGYDFVDPSKTRYHRAHTLKYKNGYRVPEPFPTVGIGGYPLNVNQLNEDELEDCLNIHPVLTYGRAKPPPLKKFIPEYAALDKKILRFFAYFKETVTESPDEHYRVRKVIIYYHLDDDSMHIYEPAQLNSGLPQGYILKRQRVPKNDDLEFYTWKDLNIGMNITIYGRVYRIADCDEFTKKFFEAEGILLNEPESLPIDSYLVSRAKREEIRTSSTKSAYDSRRQFNELDRQVLRFYALWDDRKEQFGDLRKFAVLYYLGDDTMEVREYHTPNDGRDPCIVLIRRHRFPKNRDDIPASFPSACMEISSNEIKEFYCPKDLRVGESIVVYGRAFLLYDCDSFTKAWYYQNYGLTDFKPIAIEQTDQQMNVPKLSICDITEKADSNGQSHLTPTKFNLEHQVDAYNKCLRYGANLVSVHQSDSARKFILSYRLADDMIQIWEIPVKNSGFPGGAFLKRMRVRKPKSSAEKPEYYGPNDFYIGSVIDIFGTRFIITEADEFVVKYMEAHRNEFSDDLIENLFSRVVSDSGHPTKKDPRHCMKGGAANLQRVPEDTDQMVEELSVQFRKLGLTDESRLDALFLKCNKDRLCYLDIESLKDICRKLQLPQDEDVLNRFLDKYGTDGRMTIDEFRAFFLDKEKPQCTTATSADSKVCI
ncbi:hypothetical protein Aperf_G00000068386 [Anoplocephala perfoliata]